MFLAWKNIENDLLCQNVPHTIFMQISDAITGKCMFRHISANSAHHHASRVCAPCPVRADNYIDEDGVCGVVALSVCHYNMYVWV